MSRYLRRLTPMVLALGMILAPAATPSARAQEAPGTESKGDPVPGYLGVGLLAMLVLFIVGKSARRS